MNNTYKVDVKFNFFQDWDIEKLLEWTTFLLEDAKNIAKTNAPVLSWNLRRSIIKETFQPTLNEWIIWRIWSKLKYAKRREFENYKNPHRKFYMKKAKDYIQNNIWNVLKNNLDKIIKENNEL